MSEQSNNVDNEGPNESRMTCVSDVNPDMKMSNPGMDQENNSPGDDMQDGEHSTQSVQAHVNGVDIVNNGDGLAQECTQNVHEKCSDGVNDFDTNHITLATDKLDNGALIESNTMDEESHPQTNTIDHCPIPETNIMDIVDPESDIVDVGSIPSEDNTMGERSISKGNTDEPVANLDQVDNDVLTCLTEQCTQDSNHGNGTPAESSKTIEETNLTSSEVVVDVSAGANARNNPDILINGDNCDDLDTEVCAASENNHITNDNDVDGKTSAVDQFRPGTVTSEDTVQPATDDGNVKVSEDPQKVGEHTRPQDTPASENITSEGRSTDDAASEGGDLDFHPGNPVAPHTLMTHPDVMSDTITSEDTDDAAPDDGQLDVSEQLPHPGGPITPQVTHFDVMSDDRAENSQMADETTSLDQVPEDAESHTGSTMSSNAVPFENKSMDIAEGSADRHLESAVVEEYDSERAMDSEVIPDDKGGVELRSVSDKDIEIRQPAEGALDKGSVENMDTLNSLSELDSEMDKPADDTRQEKALMEADTTSEVSQDSMKEIEDIRDDLLITEAVEDNLVPKKEVTSSGINIMEEGEELVKSDTMEDNGDDGTTDEHVSADSTCEVVEQIISPDSRTDEQTMPRSTTFEIENEPSLNDNEIETGNVIYTENKEAECITADGVGDGTGDTDEYLVPDSTVGEVEDMNEFNESRDKVEMVESDAESPPDEATPPVELGTQHIHVIHDVTGEHTHLTDYARPDPDEPPVVHTEEDTGNTALDMVTEATQDAEDTRHELAPLLTEQVEAEEQMEIPHIAPTSECAVGDANQQGKYTYIHH